MELKSIIWKVVGGVILGIVIAIAMSLLFAFPIKWTWNATMPYLFGFPVINWGKAWCLSFLAGSLIKTTNFPSNQNINKRDI
jgi:cadmium resistance protein CadD (predicted permease)